MNCMKGWQKTSQTSVMSNP